MKLSAPRFITFLISTILAVLALLNLYVPSVPRIPIVSGNELVVIVIAYVLLWLGALLPGI
jgi:hypothetical protein